MKIFYFLVTGLQDYKKCEWGLLKTYFEDNGGFLMAFFIAIGIALIMSLLFYVVMGRKFSLSKLSVWVGMLVLSGILSFGVTAWSTGVFASPKASYGLPKQIKTLEDQRRKQQDPKAAEIANKLRTEQLDFGKNKTVRTVAIMNLFYTLLFFYLFSLVFKREPITKFAIYIPHMKP